jgi:hypothetical protein
VQVATAALTIVSRYSSITDATRHPAEPNIAAHLVQSFSKVADELAVFPCEYAVIRPFALDRRERTLTACSTLLRERLTGENLLRRFGARRGGQPLRDHVLRRLVVRRWSGEAYAPVAGPPGRRGAEESPCKLTLPLVTASKCVSSSVGKIPSKSEHNLVHYHAGCFSWRAKT